MDLKLEGRRVLVTGGSKGIGLAIAISFAREGALLIIISRSAEALEKATRVIKNETGVVAQAMALDLASPDAIESLIAGADDVDILVNNAGAIPGGSLTAVDDAKWHRFERRWRTDVRLLSVRQQSARRHDEAEQPQV